MPREGGVGAPPNPTEHMERSGCGPHRQPSSFGAKTAHDRGTVWAALSKTARAARAWSCLASGPGGLHAGMAVAADPRCATSGYGDCELLLEEFEVPHTTVPVPPFEAGVPM